jgi:hypothetical protein
MSGAEDAVADKLSDAEAGGAEAQHEPMREFEVDLWLTDLNTTEVGVYQNSRNRAKSRQFTADMDIFGEIKEKGARVALLGYRSELWDKKTGMDKRLVIKLFSDSMRWRGTLDMMLGRSLQLTTGAKGIPVTAFSVNIANHDQIVQLERSASKWPMVPENFSFFVVKDLKDGTPAFYRLRRNWVSTGDDYVLYDGRDRQVGKINGRMLSIAGKWKVQLTKEVADTRLEVVLQLFCGMLKFHTACQQHLEDLRHGMRKGHWVPQLDAQEADLYLNPRRTR